MQILHPWKPHIDINYLISILDAVKLKGNFLQIFQTYFSKVNPMAQSDFIHFLPLPKEWVIISINKEHVVEMHTLTFGEAGETVGGLWSHFISCQVFSKMLDPRCVQLDPRCVQLCSEDPEEPGLGKVTGRNQGKLVGQILCSYFILHLLPMRRQKKKNGGANNQILWKFIP